MYNKCCVVFPAKGRISYADVERYVVTHGDVYAEEMEDILEAFRVLDKCGNGKISVTDFRRCMTTMGDRMSVDEVEEIIKYAKSDGFIEYEGRHWRTWFIHVFMITRLLLLKDGRSSHLSVWFFFLVIFGPFFIISIIIKYTFQYGS